MSGSTLEIDIKKIDTSIELLRHYIDDDRIESVISVLTSLKNEPSKASILTELSETLNSLGILQGAVLTYAPYISVLASNNLFEDFD